MVNFSVFNELSLPINNIKEFDNFFQVLQKLRDLGLEKIRMDKEFKQFDKFYKNKTFQEFLGQITDKTQQRRLKSFIVNNIIMIETPLIKKEEIEQEELLANEYFL